MKYSHLDEGFDFQVIFEDLLFTYPDVDIGRRHVANALKNYGKQEAAQFDIRHSRTGTYESQRCKETNWNP